MPEFCNSKRLLFPPISRHTFFPLPPACVVVGACEWIWTPSGGRRDVRCPALLKFCLLPLRQVLLLNTEGWGPTSTWVLEIQTQGLGITLLTLFLLSEQSLRAPNEYFNCVCHMFTRQKEETEPEKKISEGHATLEV